MSIKQTLLASAILAAKLVASHSVITNAVGDAGGSGMALGVVSSTPRDGTRRRPFQQDATRFRGASADTFGETVGAGDNKLEQGTQSIMAETGDSLPQVTPGGQLQMTLHQVNSDGAGPYTCMINADGTGGDWTNIQVTQNVDGNQRGRNRDGQAADHPLTAAIPQNQQCSGNVAGQDNVCLVRCQNPAAAGPFGGVIPVQMAGANNGTNTGNANAGNTGNAGSNTGTNTGNGNNGNAGNNNNNSNNGNTGNANAGTGNNNGNAGSNTGNGNTGTGNAGSNTGNGNTGNGNTGTGNAGSNTGNAGSNTGNGNTGNGNTGTGTNNGNTGSNTGGLGPNITPIANQGSGNANTGNANTGNANTGSNTNTGSNNGNNGNINRRAKTEEALEDIEEIGDEHEDRRRAIKFIA